MNAILNGTPLNESREVQSSMIQVDEYMERAIENIKLARKSSYGTIKNLVPALKEAGVSRVSEPTISKYEREKGKPDSPDPSLEYIIGLHLLTGVSLDVLCGKNVWGENGFSSVDDRENGYNHYEQYEPQVEEIVRMIRNLPGDLRDIIEAQVAAAYIYSKVDKVEEMRKAMGLQEMD